MNNELLVRSEVAALASDYDIIGEIGRGGLSVVYLARERELGREVAIKVIRNNYLEDPEALERLNREARMLAQLQHPNIVTILAAKRLPDETLALVMQLARGSTLRAALDLAGPYSPDRAVSVLRQIGSALTYIHQRGIIHRDVKPENVFTEEEGRVLLSDLGIAKANDAATNVTLAGVVVGTPAYMSPEQIDGGALDGRSDLYSLALVGYEMLSGSRPWNGENLYSIILKQKTQSLPPLTSIRDDVPAHVVHALERAMAKDRDERWPSVDDFLRQLNAPTETAPVAVLAGVGPIQLAPAPVALVPEPRGEMLPVGLEPSIAEPPPLPARSRRGWRAAALAAAVAAVVIVPTISLLRQPEAVPTSAPPAGPLADASATSAPSALLPLPTEPDPAPAEPSPQPLAAADPGPSLLPSPERPAVRPPAPAASTALTPLATMSTADARRVDSALAAHSFVPRTTSITPAIPLSLQPEAIAAPQPQGRERAPQLRNAGAVGAMVREQYAAAMGRERVGGTAVLDLTIDPAGRVVQSHIAVTSGHSTLDDIAIRVAARMRFAPGERNGAAVQSRVQIPLVIEPLE